MTDSERKPDKWWCRECGSVTTNKRCNCVETGTCEPDIVWFDEEAYELIARLRQELADETTRRQVAEAKLIGLDNERAVFALFLLFCWHVDDFDGPFEVNFEALTENFISVQKDQEHKGDCTGFAATCAPCTIENLKEHLKRARAAFKRVNTWLTKPS